MSNDSDADRIVAIARSWLGTPYHHQASRRQVGVDCLGLIRGIYYSLYGYEPEPPPPYSADWAEARREETLLLAARRHLIEIVPHAAVPGDILAFRWRAGLPAKHLAILSAPGRFIHATEGSPVCEVKLTPWWARHVAAAFAFPRPLPITAPHN